MIRDFAAQLVRNYRNAFGWRTDRKILVMESDDWGSIRMPSREVFIQMIDCGYPLASTQYNRYDTLESNEDMSRLLEVLSRHQNQQGQRPRLTANTIMANPDFDQIRASGFSTYHFEHFWKTLDRYPDRGQVWALHQEGSRLGLLRHQFHGREHLNVARWMRALRNPESATRSTFDFGVTYSGVDDYSYMEALDVDEASDLQALPEILESGLTMFEETFGYRSASFIAPCYTWDSSLESVLKRSGVQFVQSGPFQYVPLGGFNNYRKELCRLGLTKPSGLTHLMRNCFFEPSLVQKHDWVDYVLASMADAFRWGKPAVLCTHRINFMGALVPENRDRNLLDFDRLLKSVVTRWPDIEFLSSDELGHAIETDQHA